MPRLSPRIFSRLSWLTLLEGMLGCGTLTVQSHVKKNMKKKKTALANRGFQESLLANMEVVCQILHILSFPMVQNGK
ncbi:hypothetical protein ACJW30_08G120700 [Castanea mollissima]